MPSEIKVHRKLMEGISNHRISICNRKGGEAMNVFELMQVVGFALTLFMIGYTLGKKNSRPVPRCAAIC